MNKSAVGVVQQDGRVLVARIANGKIETMLRNHYATPIQATMLTSLGDIATIGETPAKCTLASNPCEPSLIDIASFERLFLDGATHFHLYDRGRWTSWSDEAVAVMALDIEEE